MKLSELKYDPVGNFWYDDEGLNLGPLWMQNKAIELEAEVERLREGLQLWIDFAANSLEFRMFLASDERYRKIFQLTDDALKSGESDVAG